MTTSQLTSGGDERKYQQGTFARRGCLDGFKGFRLQGVDSPSLGFNGSFSIQA